MMNLVFKLESHAFNDDEMIPKKYTCDGENISPPLKWKDMSWQNQYSWEDVKDKKKVDDLSLSSNYNIRWAYLQKC